jgi:hypothetical protein
MKTSTRVWCALIKNSSKNRFIRLTHLCDVFSRTAEINECYIHKVRAVADCDSFFFECVLRSHRNDLPQFQIL